MSVLRLAVLGPPEVLHDERRLAFPLRKAQALLLYLAVEGGLHSRSKLAALLWPDSEPQVARKALRNAIVLLRSLLADPTPSAAPASLSRGQEAHLLTQGDLIGLNPQAFLELDLDVVQQAYTAAQLFSTPPSEPQRATLVSQMQQALYLVRGPFLDGFWLREETGFDAWVEQQQQQWQVRLQLLCERLSAWQEAGGELEQAKATLVRWLALDPLSEEAYRRLMRVHVALGDATAALQIYATCRARLADELQVEPSADTVALAAHIRTIAARRQVSSPSHSASAESPPPGELVAPLVGRAAAFSQLVARYQQARQGQPQAVLVVGEAGIGKTRLAIEFVAWARAQGTEVLSGHAFEMGGRLPYQPLVEALRPRLEEENSPEDLLEDLWLAELSRILPELRVRYPDLPAPTQDELTAKIRLFEAVTRLLDALAQRSPLMLLLDDLHWVDGASLDVVRYLGRYWKSHGTRVLLLGTVRSEGLELNPALAAQLADLGRDLPLTQVTLRPLSQAETNHLVQALTGEAEHGTSSRGERREHGLARPATAGPGAGPSPTSETPVVALGDFLFAHTSGQPLYLLETLKMLRDRQWLLPQLGADGIWRLEPTIEMVTAIAQDQSGRELLPPSVRALVLTRLAKLATAARQLVQATTVLGTQATAEHLWQVAEVGVQAGIEALEEEVGVGNLGSYRFSHDLVREVVYTELGAARRQVLHQRALVFLQTEGTAAAELAYHARAAGEIEATYGYSVQAGMEAVAVFAVADAIGYYEQARALLQEHVQQIMTEASEVERLYVHLGQAYVFQNDWERAQEALEELLAYGKQHQLPALASMTLNRLAILAVQQTFDKPQVRALLEEARQMAEISNDQRALSETEWNFAQITAFMWEDLKRALPHGEHALELARGIQDQELEARSLSLLGWIHIEGGNFEEAIHLLEAALALYVRLSNEPTAARELSLPFFAIGAPLTQPLTNRASEAWCWEMLAMAKLHQGQVQPSIDHSRRALALAKETKNVWAQVVSTVTLTHGLLDAGTYEEALVLMQHAIAQAPTLPRTIKFPRLLTALGSTYQALQQWEEARNTLEEAEAMAERLGRELYHVPVLSQLCMHYAVAGQWEAAYRYASKAIALHKSYDAILIPWDFYSPYETEALVRGGQESQARAAVHRLGEGLGPKRRYRIPYLRSLAALAEWEGCSEQTIDYLREAAQLAADLELPGEQWQIQAALGTLYEIASDSAQARTAFREAARIIQGLAEGIQDETLRARFLAGPQIQPVMQHL